MFRKQVSGGILTSLVQGQAQETAVLFVLRWVLARAASLIVPWDKSHGCCMTVGIYMAVSVCAW